MPPTGYLTPDGIDYLTQVLGGYPYSFTQTIDLPHRSIDGRTIRAIRIGRRREQARRGVILLGGTHAREIVNPDLLLDFVVKLIAAEDGGGIGFGIGEQNTVRFPANDVEHVLNDLDLFIVPLVNPDGRWEVLRPGGDPSWRGNGNRRPAERDYSGICKKGAHKQQGPHCQKGVDLNRNYEFLWDSGLGTCNHCGSSSCNEIYRGVCAFSEPETRNIRWLWEEYPNVDCLIDIHSSGEYILHPWGHNLSQTTDASMNWRNPAHDGRMAAPDYAEYMPARDVARYWVTARRMRDAIQSVGGRVYRHGSARQLLYVTSGTTDDFFYSRGLIDDSRRRTLAFTLETGTQFAPDYQAAREIFEEVGAGLFRFLLDCAGRTSNPDHAFASGEPSPFHAAYRFLRYNDGGLEPHPASAERRIEVATGELLPAVPSSGKNAWWSLEHLLG